MMRTHVTLYDFLIWEGRKVFSSLRSLCIRLYVHVDYSSWNQCNVPCGIESSVVVQKGTCALIELTKQKEKFQLN